MAAITKQDCEAALACVGRLCECHGVEQFAQVALEQIPQLVACDHATFNYVAPTIPRVRVLGRPDTLGSHAVREASFAHYLAEQPILKHYLATGDGGAYKLSDFLSVRAYHALPLYKHLYHQLHYEDQLAFMLFEPGSELISIALARDRRSFTERDRAILNLLRPHVARAYRHVEQLSRWRSSLSGGEPGLQSARVTTVRLNAQNRPVRYGGEAQRWLDHFFAETAKDSSGLPGLVTNWLRRAEVSGELRADIGSRGALTRDRGDERLRLRLMPGESDSERLLVLDLQVVDQATQRPLAQNLTLREVEVLREVEEGKSNDEVSVALGISSLTVRTHLEHIFKKLHTSSRTGAVTRFRRLGERLAVWIAGAMLVLGRSTPQFADMPV